MPGVGRRSEWPRGCPWASMLVTMAGWSRSVAGLSRSRQPRDDPGFDASGPLDPGGRAACFWPVRGPRLQHHLPLPDRWTSGENGPMREGASRDRGARRGGGAGGCCTLGAEVSWLLWPAATLGLRSDPFAALVWWWARIATAATGPLRQLRDHPRAAPRASTSASRLRDRRRRAGPAGLRLWPEP